jgi:hypothetical protein
MPIPYFTNRTPKKPHAIDRVLAQREVSVKSASASVTSSAISDYIYNNTDWQIDSISLNFSAATSRSYSVSVANGATIVSGRNDFLFIEASGLGRRQIFLTPGFYTGVRLATLLQNALNADTVFSGAGRTFTVVYSSTLGTFTITPNSGTIRYVDFDNTQPLPLKQSIAGYIYGLTANTSYTSSIASNSNVYGLNNEAWIIDATGSTVTEHYHDDIHVLSVNQAIHVESNTASGLIISYQIAYENLE